MYRKLAVGYAPDRHGRDALALARFLASAASAEEVVVVEARRGSGAASPEPAATGWPAHVNVSPRVVSDASSADALISAADELAADLLVLGSSHRGRAGRVLVGTTAGRILPNASWPVAIAPRGYADEPSSLARVGVAFDGSKESVVALRWGAGLAEAFSAKLRLVAVLQPPAPPMATWGAGVPPDTWDSGFPTQAAVEAFEAMGEEVRGELRAARVAVGRDDAEIVVITGDARHELRGAAEDLDVLVLGSHREGRVTGALMHSVSRGLAHACPVPLVVVPPGV